MENLNNIMNQLDLSDLYKTHPSPPAGYIFFSSAQGTFTKTDHNLGHKTILNKFKRIQIIQDVLSDQIELN